MAFDAITAMNFTLCAVIVALGYFGYARGRNRVPLYIGTAFGLFGISHLVNLLAIAGTADALIVIRTLGYLSVIYALYILWAGKGRKK